MTVKAKGAKTQCPICQAWVKNKFMPNHVSVKHTTLIIG